MTTTEDKKTLSFSLAELTWGQLEFLTDYTGKTNDEMIEAFASRDLKGRDIIAILAISQNPDDPASAVEDIRNMAVADVRLNFADADVEETFSEISSEDD